jgi:4-hydroxy-tetrahydrodipicolinate reductase
MSANLSFGIQVVKELLRKASSLLKDDFDIEIVETHHRAKADAPSGTAKMLIHTITEASEKDYQYVYGRSGMKKRNPDEIGIHSIRCGSIVGDHSVIFASDEEVITITHQAQSKAVFIQGAIRAALFLAGKPPGLYSMDDLTRCFGKDKFEKEGENHAGIS